MFKFFNKLTLSILVLITFLGIYIRYVNISPYKFYPDSYQNLLVAKNLIDYKNVAGMLGANGVSYPPYFMWSRPIYPIFILLFNVFFKDLTYSAQFTSNLFGVLAIIGIYFLVRNILKSKTAGIIASLLLAISFNHTIWSGYIMSDTTGIFFSILFIALLFSVINKESQLADYKEILIGVVYGIAVFSRYEYILLLIPVLYLLLSGKSSLAKTINIFCGFIVFSSIIMVSIFPPISDTVYNAITEFPKLIIGGVIGLVLFTTIYSIRIRLKKILDANKIFEKIGYLIMLLSILPLVLTLLNLHLPVFIGLTNFIKTDFLISTLAILGIALMFLDKSNQKLVIFITIYILISEWVYFKINPLQQRYHTHLLPMLIVSATYSLIYLNNYVSKNRNLKYLFYILVTIGVIYQVSLSRLGFSNWNSGDWKQKSYEEVSATTLNKYLTSNEFIFAAMPEPYYYFTNHATRSISEGSPYLYLKELEDERDIVIVNDMAMRDIFPDFSKFVGDNLTKYKLAQYLTNINYRYKFYAKSEEYPVVVYRLKLKDLKNKLNFQKY